MLADHHRYRSLTTPFFALPETLNGLESIFAAHAAEEASAASQPPPTLLEWAKRCRRIDGHEFDLARFRPLWAIYADPSPRITIIKPAQRGVSEWAVNRAIYTLDVGHRVWGEGKDGLNVGYLFPALDALREFSKERIGGLADESDYLAGIFHNPAALNAIGFKKVGRSFLYLRGTISMRALRSFAADAIVWDEFDAMPADLADFARSRLGASDVRHELRLSTPSLPNIGIDAAYQQSDQRVWVTHCPACGASNSLDFLRDVWIGDTPADGWRRWPAERIRLNEPTITTRCPNCRAAIDPHGPGEWIVGRPELSDVAHGYRVPWNGFPFVRLVEMCVNAAKSAPHEVARFYNDDLGQPHESAGTHITPDMLDQLPIGDWGGDVPDLPPTAWHNTTMGVDIGARFHYRITSTTSPDPNDLRIVRDMGMVDSWEEVAALIKRYRVRVTVVDAQPEVNSASRFVADHRGRALRAFFGLDGDDDLIRLGRREDKGRRRRKSGPAGSVPVSERDGTIEIHRTRALDDLQSAIATAAEYWPERFTRDHEIRAQMCALVRGVEKDRHGNERAVWRNTAPDHYAFASLYNRMAHNALPRAVVRAPVSAGARGWHVPAR